MKKWVLIAALVAAVLPLRAQTPGSEYSLRRVIPVEGRQGIAADSCYYYVSGSTALYKYDKQGNLVAKNEKPFEGLPLAANHLDEIEGLAVDPATGDLLVLANRGSRIVLGMPRGLYPGYYRELHELHVYSTKPNETKVSTSGSAVCQ